MKRSILLALTCLLSANSAYAASVIINNKSASPVMVSKDSENKRITIYPNSKQRIEGNFFKTPYAGKWPQSSSPINVLHFSTAGIVANSHDLVLNLQANQRAEVEYTNEGPKVISVSKKNMGIQTKPYDDMKPLIKIAPNQ